MRDLAVRAVAILVVCLVALAAPAAAQGPAVEDQPLVVVTTEVLGAVVAELVGTVAEVKVLMPHGTDPHSWQPSARDTESVFGAEYVIANGLGLEQGLVDILEQAAADGVPVFRATDHVELRDGEGPGQAEDVPHEHEPGDPHFWLDPTAMHDVVVALGLALREVGIDVDTSALQLADELDSLDAELASILAIIPEEDRKLVTGHDSLGYFADRYGFAVVGTVIPGQTTSMEPSARDLVDLIAAVRAQGVRAIFTEVATPQSVARALADEAGVRIVELDVGQLPEGGTYADFMRGLAQTIASALTP